MFAIGSEAPRDDEPEPSLPASPDVEKAYLEPGGLIERARSGTILIDLSSVLPSTPRKPTWSRSIFPSGAGSIV